MRRSRVIQGSCWACKKRRIKCDLQSPSCTRCLDRGQTCSYSTTPPIKWVGGGATRGRLASRRPASSPFSGLVLASSPGSQPLQSGEAVLYFASAVLPRFQILGDESSWDLGGAMQDEALRQSIVAVSQAHYLRCSKLDVYNVAVVRERARQAAIEGFRRCLEQDSHSESSVQRLLEINIFFCMLDGMIEPSGEPHAATCHLRGGWAMLRKWPDTPTRMLLQGDTPAHLLSIYATMDLVHALLHGNKPFFESTIWGMFAGVRTWFGVPQAGDRFLDILAAFSDMARLGSLVYTNLPLDTVSLVEKCLAPIEAALGSERDEDGSFDGAGSGLSSSWASLCSIYEACGLIYLQRALRLRPATDDAVQMAARRGVEKLMDKNLPMMMRHCAVFPMLVIGTHCTLTEDRRAILRAISPSSSNLSFGSMQLMDGFLKAYWAREGACETWWQTFGSLSEVAFFF